MIRIGLTGLCKIELPGDTIRLCDGGRIAWSAEVFRGRDATFGTIGSVEPLSEGSGDELPLLEMTMLVPTIAAAADIAHPTSQGSRVRFWIAEWSPTTGAVIGTPELRFDGEIDQATLNLQQEVRLTIVSSSERLFELNIGNSLSAAFHKNVWPGELGHDNATGLGIPVAWGVDAPPRPVSGAGAGNIYGYDPGGMYF